MDKTDRPSVRHVLIRQVYSPVRHLWQPWIGLVNLPIQTESKIHDLELSFVHQFWNTPPSNPYLTNYGQNDYFWTLLKLLGYRLSRQSTDILKKHFKKKKKTNKSRRLAEKMCLSGVHLDVLTLELDMKVQFANFWHIEHTKKLAVW
jgi:hypothetical protein